MKRAKKFLTLLLTLTMLLSLSLTAFAVSGTSPTTKGSVQINGALKGNSFYLYQIFGLETFDTETNSYQYTIESSSPLYSTIQEMQIQVAGMDEAKTAFALTRKENSSTTYYVSLTDTFKNAQKDGPVVKLIAAKLKEAITNITDETVKSSLLKGKVEHAGITKSEVKDPNTITVTQTDGEDNTEKCDIKFPSLELGYYLVDSTAGAMIGLTTTNPNGVIEAKNKLPGVDKEVKKNDGVWDNANTMGIGETVEYRVTVNVAEGAKNYVIYDDMSEGVSFGKITRVYYGYPTNPADAYIIYDRSETKNADGTITTANKGETSAYGTFESNVTYMTKANETKTCDFKITFNQTFLDQVLNDTSKDDVGYTKAIYVEYTGKLNENAVIGDAGNPNDVYLTYGDNNVEVGHDTVTTKTYQMELVKHKDTKEVLANAQFEVYDTEADAIASRNPFSFVKLDDENGKQVYRIAAANETNTTTTIIAGDVIIKGLGGSMKAGDNIGRSYYFKEIKAPDGFTQLAGPVACCLLTSNKMATFEVDGKYKEGGLGIENRSGNLLPETGGIGTTVFYVVGSILLVGAGVLLVTKRRMNADK